MMHHIDEYNQWMREHGPEQSQSHFVSTLDEYNRLNGTDFSDWAEVLESALKEDPAKEYSSPLRYFEEFEKAAGLIPTKILRLHREENVPLIYF